jgi:hypothetical protein
MLYEAIHNVKVDITTKRNSTNGCHGGLRYEWGDLCTPLPLHLRKWELKLTVECSFYTVEKNKKLKIKAFFGRLCLSIPSFRQCNCSPPYFDKTRYWEDTKISD